jgi:hypothetical protein
MRWLVDRFGSLVSEEIKVDRGSKEQWNWSRFQANVSERDTFTKERCLVFSANHVQLFYPRKVRCAFGRTNLDQFFKETVMKLNVIRPVNSSRVRFLRLLPAMRSFRKLFFSQKAPVEPQTPASKPPRPRPLNEENMRRYSLGGFHPVSIGDSFKDGRYQVIRKLGFGIYSTVWLCRDHLYNYFPRELKQGRHNLLP